MADSVKEIPPNQQYERLRSLLAELFQLDQPELDFGFYRVMHAKADEVTAFLDEDLLPQVKEAFELYRPADKAELERQLAEAVQHAEGAGVSLDDSPTVIKARANLLNNAVDIRALEREVYDHLFRFFRRYYSDGDFLSKRVYKPGVYAIPYEGEEVVLHWANRDQYYIKTSEYLREYVFRLRPHDVANPMRVHFQLVDASEGEHGDVKPVDGKDRLFILAQNSFIDEVNGELFIRFEYRPALLTDWPEQLRAGKTKAPVQRELITLAIERVLEDGREAFVSWVNELSQPDITASGAKADFSRFDTHLRRYTARNTFDYFVHKDLATFLRRELDFYIKNEVMYLDDVESESAPRVEEYISKIKVIRRVAGKIIDFLSQLEDFQKKLWLKKKFVVQTSYFISLARVPADLFPEVAANEAQREEWVELFAIDELGGDPPIGYSTPLTVQFLEAHRNLVVDARHFSDDFNARLLESIGDIDEHTDGLLIHSENFQALNLIRPRYLGQVTCIYIDPPYNTDASAIDYKNGYKVSSWASMVQDRVSASRALLVEDGVLVCAIDDEQQRELNFILTDGFGRRPIGVICVRSNPSGRPMKSGYSVSHEYLLFAGRSAESAIGRMPPTPQQLKRFSNHDERGAFEWRNLRREGSNSDRAARRALYYPIFLHGEDIRVPKMTWDSESQEWKVDERPLSDEQVAWPTNKEGVEKTWRWEGATVMDSLGDLSVRKDQTGRDYVYYKRRPHEAGVVSVSAWFDAKYSATEHGTAVLKALFGGPSFSYPKSIHAVVDAIYVAGASKPGSLVLDYFAGSGTTGHAVINLNRSDDGRRKFILAETGAYFDTVLVPRIKKVAFSPEWKDGKPKRPPTQMEADRGPRLVKVIRLESYEDTLNNLEPARTQPQQTVLGGLETHVVDGLNEEYMLRYMLDVETRGSQSLLNLSAFNDPTAYNLRVKRPGTDESTEMRVDLLETFNWLIGLTVQRITAPETWSATFERSTEKRLKLNGPLTRDAAGRWWFRTVTGTMRDGRHCLIIWRKLTGNLEEDNLVLDEWFKAHGFSPSEHDLQLVYVNGDSNLENLKAQNETWTVRLIEDDFQRLMFDVAPN